MKKSFYLVPLLLLLAFAGAAVSVVSAQVAVTLVPPTIILPTVVLPTVVPPTVAPPTIAPPTIAPPTTVPATAQPTTAATTQATAQATASGAQATTSGAQATLAPSTPEATVETTDGAPVESEVESIPTAESAFYRFAHFAPGDQQVDIYIDNVLTFRDVAFPQVTRFIALAPGTHTIVVTPADSAVSEAVLEPFAVEASADVWTTIAVLASDDSGTLETAQIVEDYDDLLPGTAGFTFVNALAGSPTVTLRRDTVAYFTGMDFGSFSSLRVDAGTFEVHAEAADDPSNVLARDENLDLQENSYILVALLTKGDETRLLKFATDRSVVDIARGLLPVPGRLLDALRADDNLTTFAQALSGSDLADMLSSSEREYTIFAPANVVLDSSDTSGIDWELMLSSYIVEGKYTSQELLNAGTLTALDDTTLTITVEDNHILVNGVQLIDVNVAATNGVIHVLNGLWPPND